MQWGYSVTRIIRPAVGVVLLAAFVSAPSARCQPAAQADDETTAVQLLTPLAAGTNSGIAEPREVVVSTAEEWRALWQAHGTDTPPPAVDFSAEMIVGVFLGTRPTPGYSIEIVSVVEEQGTVVVEYVEHEPAADAMVAQVLTTPFSLAKLRRRDVEIEFRRTDDPPGAARALQ